MQVFKNSAYISWMIVFEKAMAKFVNPYKTCYKRNRFKLVVSLVSFAFMKKLSNSIQTYCNA